MRYGRRRRRNWTRASTSWLLLLSALGAFALAMGYRWLERGGTFDLDTVRIRGIRQQDSLTVCTILGPLFGTSIWRIDCDSIADVLTDVSGISSAAVKRLPFTAVLVTVELERVVLAVQDSAGVYPVSASGQRLPETFLSDTLPLVCTSVGIDEEIGARLAVWLDDLGPQGGISGMTYSSDGLTVVMDAGCSVLLSTGDLRRGWDGFTALVSAMDGIAEWDLVDMRFSGQAVLSSREPESMQEGEGS